MVLEKDEIRSFLFEVILEAIFFFVILGTVSVASSFLSSDSSSLRVPIVEKQVKTKFLLNIPEIGEAGKGREYLKIGKDPLKPYGFRPDDLAEDQIVFELPYDVKVKLKGKHRVYEGWLRAGEAVVGHPVQDEDGSPVIERGRVKFKLDAVWSCGNIVESETFVFVSPLVVKIREINRTITKTIVKTREIEKIKEVPVEKRVEVEKIEKIPSEKEAEKKDEANKVPLKNPAETKTPVLIYLLILIILFLIFVNLRKKK